MNYLKVSDNIFLVGRGTWGGLKPLTFIGDSNIFLIDGGSELALVDAGGGPNLSKLIVNISLAGYSVRNIKKVIVTHNHVDHIEGIAPLRKKIKFSVIGAKGSFFKLKIDKYVKEGDTLNVGDLKFKVMVIPGHTPDSIALVGKINGKKVLISGDTAIGDQQKWKGVVGWYSAHWGSDLKDFRKSMKRLLKLNADIMIPGHGVWHKGKAAVRKSLKNCIWRLDAFAKIPHLGTMLPITLDKKTVKTLMPNSF